MPGLTAGRRHVLAEIVIPNLGGVDHVLGADPTDLIDRFHLRCRRMSAVSMTSLRSVGIVDWSNDLTPAGVTALKALAAEIKSSDALQGATELLRPPGKPS